MNIPSKAQQKSPPSPKLCYNKLMDNNYEQQFAQSLNTTPTPVKAGSNSKLPLIVAIILAVITLVESIALLASLTNQSNLTITENVEEDTEDIDDTEYSAAEYKFDDDDNVIALKLNCKDENGSSFELTTDQTYQQSNGSGQVFESGTYTITRDGIISLSGSNNNGRVIFYDGLILADGNTIYKCQTNELTENTEGVDE